MSPLTVDEVRRLNARFKSPGLSVPSGWGSALKAKLPTKAVVAYAGDSVLDGYYASNLDTVSGRSLMTAYLQGKYGNGGSGFAGASRSTPFATAAGIPSTAYTAYVAAGNYFTLTGGWSNYGGTDYGPGKAAISAGGAASATYTVTGTTIDIWTIGGNGSWTYQIDGGSAVAGTVGSYGAQRQRITGQSAGTHTVKVNWVSGTVFVVGVAGENAAGVVCNNFSIYGGQAGYYANKEGTIKNGRYSGGSLYPTDALVYGMGLNDAAANISTASYIANVRQNLDDVLDGVGGNAGATDLMFVIQHIGKYDPTNHIFQDHAAALIDLATAYGGAIVNMFANGNGSYAKWSALNYWGNAVTVGATGSDLVHLSDAGQANLGAALVGALQMAGI